MGDLTDGFDPLDRELRALGRAAMADAERRADADAGLARVLDRADLAAPAPPARSPWLLLGAAAAIVGLIVGGVVMSRGGDDTVRTATSDAPVVPAAAPESSGPAPATTAAPATTPATVPSTDVAASSPETTSAPSTSVPPPAPESQLPIERRCVDGYGCTQLASTADGRIAAYDPVDGVVAVLDASAAGVESRVAVVPPFADRSPWLVGIGPDDVAYFGVAPDGAGDPILDLVAVPLRGPSAGSVVVVEQGLDGSGDTDLVPTADGFAAVGCCGFDSPRPRADAWTIPWIDGNGDPITSNATLFEWRLGETRDVITRVDGGVRTEFEAPLLATSPRGMPWLVATDDGGALMLDYSQQHGVSYIARFRPGVDVEEMQLVQLPAGLWGAVALLEAAGTVIVSDGDRFVRRTLDEIGPPIPETGVAYRTEPGQAIASCRDRAALAIDDVGDPQLDVSVHGGPVGETGVYIAIDDGFGRRLMTGCGESAAAPNPLAGEGVLVWPMDGVTGVALAKPIGAGGRPAPDWLGTPIAQLGVEGTDTAVDVYVVADEVELSTEPRDVEQLWAGLVEQARVDGTVTASFGPALGG